MFHDLSLDEIANLPLFGVFSNHHAAHPIFDAIAVMILRDTNAIQCWRGAFP